MHKIRFFWKLLLATFRLSDVAICEMSVGLGPYEDFHDYPDDAEGKLTHFGVLRCKRCGKEFYI
jgi:hypothetical protein